MCGRNPPSQNIPDMLLIHASQCRMILVKNEFHVIVKALAWQITDVLGLVY